jgi:hypothetical protein
MYAAVHGSQRLFVLAHSDLLQRGPVDQEVAHQISSLMLEYFAKLNASVQLVQERCSDEEFKDYRRAIGLILGEMTTEVMMPLYRKHPELEPPEFKT